ncbi:MAG: helix-turn-helix transcriptional regulator [Pseudomonadota bacterium]
MSTHDKIKAKALKQPKVKKHYDELDSEFMLLRTLIKARQASHKSQAEVAEIMGTSTSVVRRLETGGGKQKYSPTLATLQRYAEAINKRLVVKLVSKSS